MKSVAILQARTNSSRLPGKVMLPINGIPIVVLAAKRAANTGRDVIVATSEEPTDDALGRLVNEHGLVCYRGSLDNTLERIVRALLAYEDDTLVFRLTADNVFPDGRLLDEMEEDFRQRKLDYLCCNGERSGLPYGVSVELTYLKHLREAYEYARDPYDQEHVTPYVRRKFGVAYFEEYKGLGKEGFRCTVDCLDDYLGVQAVFADVDDAVSVSSFDLIHNLKNASYQPLQDKLASKLVLGTAQLGLSYGISNQSGAPSQVLAEQIIKAAIVNGASYIDTARAYGNSEEVIGNALKSGWGGRARVITKLSPLSNCHAHASESTVNAFVDASIYQSCVALRVPSLDILMLHRASHVVDWNGALWSRLIKHREEGAIKDLGVSVQTPQELDKVLDVAEVKFIQMPFNILDWRWDRLVIKIQEKRRERGLVVHVRSALLQGLLPSKDLGHWQRAHVIEAEQVVSWLDENSQKAGVVDLCLNFAKSTEWVDGVVVGVETMPQLIENIKILCGPELSQEDMNIMLSNRPLLTEKSLNPALWEQC